MDVSELLLRISTAGFDEADAKLSAFERRIRALEGEHRVRIDVAAAEAKAKLDELARPRHMRLDVDTNTSATHAALNRIKTDLSEMGDRASNWRRWVAGAAPAIIPLVGQLAQATAGAGLLGVAAGGAATAFGVLGYAVKMSLSDAQGRAKLVETAQKRVTAAEQAYQIALETGTARQQASARRRLETAQAQLAATKRQEGADVSAAQHVITAWQGVQQTFKNVMSTGVRYTEQGLASILGDVRRDLPLLRGPFAQLGQSVRAAFTSPEVRSGLRQFVSDFGQMVRAASPLSGPILRALVSLGDIFANLARAAMPELVRLAQRFADWLGRLADKARDQEALRGTVDRLMRAFEAVGNTILHVVRAFAPLLQSGGVGQGMLWMVRTVADFVGGLGRLLNALGPVGQAIGAGLGLLLIVGRFRTWLGLIKDVVRWLGRLGGAAGGEGDVSGRAAGQNERYAQSKRRVAEAAEAAAPAVEGLSVAEGAEGAIAGEGATAASLAKRQGGLVSRLLSGLRRGLGAGARGLGGLALGGLALGGIDASALTGSIGAAMRSAASAISRSAPALRAAAAGAFGGVLAAARSAGSGVVGAASSLMRSASTAVSRAAPTVRNAARTVWNGIATAARGIPIVAAVAGLMRLGESAIRGAGGPVRSIAHTVWNGIATAARTVAIVGPIGALMRLGEGAIRAAAGPVRSIASSVWRGIELLELAEQADRERTHPS